MSHDKRPRFAKVTPAHVTVRVRQHVWNLRSGRCYRVIGSCLEKALARHGLRVIEYSVLGNHIHFIVEADDNAALSRGMQGLCIRIAKALNLLMKKNGRLFADHYHANLLTTPTQLVRAIAYVLRNHEHHFGKKGADAFASDALPSTRRRARLCIPLSWLLLSGWRRASPADLKRLRGTTFAA